MSNAADLDIAMSDAIELMPGTPWTRRPSDLRQNFDRIPAGIGSPAGSYYQLNVWQQNSPYLGSNIRRRGYIIMVNVSLPTTAVPNERIVMLGVMRLQLEDLLGREFYAVSATGAGLLPDLKIERDPETTQSPELVGRLIEYEVRTGVSLEAD